MVLDQKPRSRGASVPGKLNLAEALRRLEEIVQRLERDDLELEEAVRLFDEGMELIRGAERDLVESEGRLKQVLVDRQGRQRDVELQLPEEEQGG